MTIKLFYKSAYLSTHKSVEDAEAAARWTYFDFRGNAAPGTDLPQGFLILISNTKDYSIQKGLTIPESIGIL